MTYYKVFFFFFPSVSALALVHLKLSQTHPLSFWPFLPATPQFLSVPP